MNYEIRENKQYGSKEIYFSGKPSEEVRSALKALRFRWNHAKNCWYGFAAQNQIIAAITENEPDQLGGVSSDGYLGASRWDGLKSGKYLYGAELSAAIRAELKAQGVSGCSVRVKTFSGGQEVTVTVKSSAFDYVPFDDFYSRFRYSDLPAWIDTGKELVHRDEFIALCDGDGYDKYMTIAARNAYRQETGNIDLNYFYIDKYKIFSDDFREKLHKINAALDTFHRDNSNSMVDYFDTNFYRTISIKRADVVGGAA